jgi:hypothetical protein
VPQWLFNKSELQGQGHGFEFVKEVRAALGGRPETFGRADLVPARFDPVVERESGAAGA